MPFVFANAIIIYDIGTHVLSFLLQRAARLLLILVSVELLVFLLVHSVPGNAWDTPNNQLLRFQKLMFH